MNAPVATAAVFDAPVAAISPAPAALPANWYMLAACADLKPGSVLAGRIGQREIVLARTEAGRAIAMDAHCAHMGCHLKHGSIVGEHLRCGLHFRQIDADGSFLKPDGRRSPDLVQRTYPVAEQFGAIFVYVGGAAAPPLPLPEIIAPSRLLARPAGEFVTTTPWYALIANGFDMEHLLAVHARELKEEPVISRPDSRSFRIAYRTAVTGRGLSDRLMKWMSGNEIRASMTSIGGSMMMVQSKAGPRPSMFLLSLCPTTDGGTMVRAIAGIDGSAANLFDRLRLRLAGWLFRTFLSRDFAIFEGLDWHPPSFPHSAGDRYTRQMFDYFLSLEEAPEPAQRSLREREAQ